MDNDDVSIEAFSFALFQNMLPRFFISRKTLDRLPERENKNMPVSFIEFIGKISYCRFLLFQEFLVEKVPHQYENLSRSSMDFYLFLKNNVKSFYPTQYLIAYDKIFMSVAFTVMMSISCRNKELLRHVPYCWAMYFESYLKNSFYQDGGWKYFGFYADFYASSDLFRNMDFLHVNYYKDGFCNLKAFVEEKMKVYNMKTLKTKFEQLMTARKSTGDLTCKRCSPMLVSFWYLVYPQCSADTEIVTMEGYIQLLLQLLSDSELEENENYVRSVFTEHRLKEIVRFENHFVPDEIPHSDEVEQMRCLLESKMKSCRSFMLFQKMFIGSAEFFSNLDKPDELAKMDYYNRCIFCYQRKNRTFESPNLESESIKLIKSSIANKASSIIVDKFKTTATQIANLQKSKCMISKNTDEQNVQEEKEALRMFLALGIEPGRSKLLNSLKAAGDIECATNGVSTLSLQATQNNKQKKSKKKKKKT